MPGARPDRYPAIVAHGRSLAIAYLALTTLPAVLIGGEDTGEDVGFILALPAAVVLIVWANWVWTDRDGFRQWLVRRDERYRPLRVYPDSSRHGAALAFALGVALLGCALWAAVATVP